MQKLQLTCAPSNFKPGRPAGFQPEAIVLHRSGWTAEQIRAHYLDSSSTTSSHYVVMKAGEVLQYVAEQDTAFHAGVIINPTWKGLKPSVNPNFYTIGIELEGLAEDPIPDDQSLSSASLIAEIAARFDIAIDADHIVLHSEIRASRNCPGPLLVRSALLQSALLAASSPSIIASPSEVEILRETNLREGLPSSSVRIVSVLLAKAKVRVNSFTLDGEAVKGNSAWYQTEDGNFFWAGNSSVPQPRPEPEHPIIDLIAPSSSEVSETSAPMPVVVTTGPGCAIGISEIDQFFTDASSPPLDLKKGSRDILGTIQDLLTGHGFGLSSLLSPGYGLFNDATRKALCAFQDSCGLPADANLTSETMKRLVGVPAKDPRATQAHFSLVLGIPFSGVYRLLALTAQMEGVGKFAALNLNTDFAGLSFGLIQWAQRPGRLVEILAAFRDKNAQSFVQIFGEGSTSTSDGLIAHLKKPSGGVNAKTGASTDPAFDLVASPWKERFKAAALQLEFQRVQVDTARAAFKVSFDRLQQYDTAKLVKSERAVAFMLDVANQFGDGRVQKPANQPDLGLAGIYRKVLRQGMQEQDLLQGIADATVAAMKPQFQNGVRARRTLFLTTPFLSSSQEFKMSVAASAQERSA
jgi:hypothetical protein